MVLAAAANLCGTLQLLTGPACVQAAAIELFCSMRTIAAVMPVRVSLVLTAACVTFKRMPQHAWVAFAVVD